MVIYVLRSLSALRDYSANCFLDLWRTPHNSENNIVFNDGRCNYRSRSYYCQPVMPKPKPRPPPPPPPAPRKIKHGNYYYASLDNVAATAKYGTDKGLSHKSCHIRQYARAVPSGWELAPYSRAILEYPWSTHCLIFNNGKSYTGEQLLSQFALNSKLRGRAGVPSGFAFSFFSRLGRCGVAH